MSLSFLIPNESFALTASHGSERSIINLFDRNRQALFDSSTSANLFNFDFDFYSPVSLDYCYLGNIANAISRADIDGNGDSIKLTFYADDNSSFTSPESSTVNIQLSDLMGQDLKDYYQALTFTTSYRYYRCRIETTMGDSIRLYLNKLWFGTIFDLGKSEDLPVQVNYKPAPIYHEKEFIFNYSNLNDDDRLIVFEQFDNYKLIRPVVILDLYDDLLNGETLSYCMVLECEYSTKVDGIYDIRITFRTNY